MIALSLETNDSYMLGESSIQPTTPFLMDLVGWLPGREGRAHPALCRHCSEVHERGFVEKAFRLRNKSFDLSVTRDGWLIANDTGRAALTTLVPGVSFFDLPMANGFVAVDLRTIPTAVLDMKASRLRADCHCDVCGAYGELLLGLDGGRPPRPHPLVLSQVPKAQLALANLFLGTGFMKVPSFFGSEAAADMLCDGSLRGVQRSAW